MQKRGKLGVRDAGAQEIGPVPQALDSRCDLEGQLSQVVGSAIGQGALGMIPDPFIGIEVGRIAREVAQMQTAVALAECFDRITFVDGGVIEQQYDRSAQMTQQLPNEFANSRPIQVVVVEAEVQTEPLALRAHRDRRDDRNLVAAGAMAKQRRLSPRRPGLDDRRDQEEARFIGEDDRGAQPSGVFFTRGQSSRFQRSMALVLRSSARRCGF